MTQPSKSNLSVQSSPFSGPSLRKPKATPGIVECVTPVSVLLSVGNGRELECPISLVDFPDAACLKPGSLVLVTLTTSTNQPSRIFIAPPANAELPSVRGIVLASNASDRKVSIRLRTQKSALLLDVPADKPLPAAGCCPGILPLSVF